MATSGQYGSTVVEVQQIIDKVIRRCGLIAEAATPEIVQTIKENMDTILADMANDGINLWKIDRLRFGLNAYQKLYQLPIQTVDLKNINYSLLQRPTAYTGVNYISDGTNAVAAFDGDLTTATGNCTYIGFTTPVSQRIITVGILFNANYTGAINLDAATNIQLLSTYDFTTQLATGTYTAGTWYYFDLDASVKGYAWRVRTATQTSYDEVVLATAGQDIPMAPLNRDDYWNLPDKDAALGSRPLQYWFDKKIQPQLFLWPVPDNTVVNANQAITVNCLLHTHIQNSGSFTNTLEIPQRWQEAVIAQIASAASYELPNISDSRIQLLENRAKMAIARASRGEDDNAPTYIDFGIGAYTA